MELVGNIYRPRPRNRAETLITEEETVRTEKEAG